MRVYSRARKYTRDVQDLRGKVYSTCKKKKVREKSRECHNHKPQPNRFARWQSSWISDLNDFSCFSILVQAMKFKIDIQDDGHFELPIYILFIFFYFLFFFFFFLLILIDSYRDTSLSMASIGLSVQE